MLIEQINHIGPEPLERTLGNLLDVLRSRGRVCCRNVA
jgi:hypothetical protein